MSSRRGDHQKVVLITGCSSGIGLSLAQLLVRETRFRLVITAPPRSLSVLLDTFGHRNSHRTMLRALDVTDQRMTEDLVREVSKLWGGVDILVNNAGICYQGGLEEISADDLHKQMEVNFFGPLNLIRLVLTSMRERRDGKIINISSVSGMMAMPTMGAYSASKFALEGASESLWYELRPWGISVSLIQAGFVHSDSFKHTRVIHGESEQVRAAYDPYHHTMSHFIDRLMHSAYATPESVAHIVLTTIIRKHPPLRVSATIDASFFNLIRRAIPRRLYHFILYHALPGVRSWVPRDSSAN
jgi:short-subunit dehydrogenase